MRMASVAKSKEPINPFYVLTAVFGVAFTITACGYGLLMLRANRSAALQTSEPVASPLRLHPLMNLLDQHGILILAIEVGLLAAASVAAIAMDHCRGKRIAKSTGEKGEQLPP